MVEAEDCEKEMVEALNRFFSRSVLVDRKPVRNDAYFNDIADKIIKELDKTRVSIHVCIAWFTNQSIADKLVEKHKQGIDVKVILSVILGCKSKVIIHHSSILIILVLSILRPIVRTYYYNLIVNDTILIVH